MGSCMSTANPQQHQHHIQNSGSQEAEEELGRAKKVIDGLNVEIEAMTREVSLLKNQVSVEKQAKTEEADRLLKAQQMLETLEAENTDLAGRLAKLTDGDEVADKPLRVTVEEHDHTEHEHKHGGHESCFGQCQSPINIISMDSAANAGQTVPLKDDGFQESGLKFNYPEKVSGCTIMNNGHTVQVNIPDSSKCKVQIYGHEFSLKQFHFHTPSEHTIDSKQYEMEMHLVHVDEEGKICVLGFIFTLGQRYQQPRLKLTKTRNHLVLAHGKRSRRNAQKSAARSEEEAEESDDLETDDEWEDDEEAAAVQKRAQKYGNDFLAQFWDQLPAKLTTEDIPLKEAISFDYLFETSSRTVKKNVKTHEIEIEMDIFEYMGSLTTPPYTEGVQWLVSKTTHFINEEQLKNLRICWDNHNNARPVQKYFGRQVSLRSKSSLRVVQ